MSSWYHPPIEIYLTHWKYGPLCSPGAMWKHPYFGWTVKTPCSDWRLESTPGNCGKGFCKGWDLHWLGENQDIPHIPKRPCQGCGVSLGSIGYFNHNREMIYHGFLQYGYLISD